MRTALPLLATLLVAGTAHAGSSRGDSDGGGRLGQVTRGVDSAAASSGSRGGSSSGSISSGTSTSTGLYDSEYSDDGNVEVLVANDGTVVRSIDRSNRPSGGPANVDVYLGIQQVVDSDRSYSVGLAVEDKWMRLAGDLTEYREEQMDGTMVGMTVPSLVFGIRFSGRLRTRAYLEGGVALARTKYDGDLESSVTGSRLGVHVDHPLGRGSAALVADVHVMALGDEIRAYSARAAFRAGVLEAGFRVLHMNVGPALYGPEVGLRF